VAWYRCFYAPRTGGAYDSHHRTAGVAGGPRRRGGRVAAWPLAANAQQPAMPVIGYLNSRSRETDTPFLAALHHGLNAIGYIEGHNVAIEYRWAEGQYDRLPVLATDLVDHRVTVMAATSTPPALAAKAATSAIPIVFNRC
jgi:putative ABC transport system substrate-binding protein